MGCWNGTCAVTQLPILAGEKIRLYLLKKTKYVHFHEMGSGVCHSNALFTPYALPLIGVYDDYGSITKIENETLGENIVSIINTENKVKFKTIYEVLSAVHENHRETPLEGNPNLLGYGFMLVHEFVFQEAIKSIQTNQKPEYRDPIIDILDKHIFFAKNSSKEISKDPWLAGYYMTSISEIARKLMLCSEFVSSAYISNDLREATLDHLYFAMAMDYMRKLFMPQAGAGSQEQIHEVYKDIAKKVISYCDNYFENLNS